MKRLLLILSLGLLLLAPASVALAAPVRDRVVGEDETVNGDVTLFGESLVVKAGGRINGDVAIMGGNADVAGTIRGDLVMFGGSLTLAETAVITGDCALFGASLQAAADLSVSCTQAGGSFDFSLPGFLNQAIPRPPRAPEIPEVPRVAPPDFPSQYATLAEIASIAGRTMAAAVLALAVAAILPSHLRRVRGAISHKPVVSGTVGLLTAAAGASVITLLSVIFGLLILACGLGLLGFPIVFALGALLLGGALLGWVAIGDLVGSWLAARLALSNRSVVVTATLGTAVLTLLVAALSALPFWLGGFAGSIMAWLLLAIGLGAAALTQFGTRPFPASLAPSGAPDSVKIVAVLETLPDREAE